MSWNDLARDVVDATRILVDVVDGVDLISDAVELHVVVVVLPGVVNGSIVAKLVSKSS